MEPPRAIFLRYPFGHPLGEPFSRAQQQQIFEDGLRLFEEAKGPTLVISPYLWRRTKFSEQP
ncbi:MAG: hypothetical protein A2508_06455 [Candidatus Lambdaproteobacteria bacterium RIFOXYD12_FULL_49_8]|nr:MAG: hypothetical protein A2508_06455 [Candidatus Lambdaproteobacteria bacterium RIFOXYD12_FULL_49_8]